MSESKIAGYLVCQLPSPSKQPIKQPFFLGNNLFGRDSSKCNISIDHRSVSGRHGELICHSNKLVIIDRGSKNGIKLNQDEEENRLAVNAEIEIYNGSVLYIGEVRCRVEWPASREDEETLVVPAKSQAAKKGENILKTIFSEDDIDENIILLHKAEKLQNRQELPSKQESDEFSLTGDFYQVIKQPPKGKKDSKEEALPKNDKKDDSEEVKKSDETAKNKKKDKKNSLQKQKQEKTVDEIIKEKEEKNKDKKGNKKQNPKEDKKDTSPVDKKPKKSKEKVEMKKKQAEKQQQLLKERQQQKKRQEQQRQKKQKQQRQRKERQQKQKRQQEQKLKINEKSRSISLRRANKQEKNASQPETSEQPPNPKKNIKKSNANSKIKQTQPAEDTKQRVSYRKRLPSEPKAEEQNYPLRKSFMNKRVLVSGFIPSLTKKYFRIVQNIQDQFDYLVMKEYKRTFKALYAICKGIYILRYQWIKESEFLEKTLKAENYLFKDIDYVYESIQKASRGYRVFAGLQFYLGSDEYHLGLQDIDTLIYAGGGELMKKIGKLTPKELQGKNKIAIVRNLDETNKKLFEEDVKRVKKLGFDEIHTIQLILDACERQQIDWKKYAAPR